MARVQYLSLPADRRTVVVSDIHGNLPYLRGLLEKIRLSRADVLILLGDMVEKGPQSLETLRAVMALREEYEVYCLLGNCDFWHLAVDRDIPGVDDWVRHYMARQKPGRGPGLLVQMCREAGVPLGDALNLPEMKRVLRQRFAAEFGFLRSLPHVIETERYTFVHGGVPAGVTAEEADPFACMKNNDLLRQGRRFDKWQIVGHTPVMLYREDITSAVPIVDEAARVVSIDGGCVLKDDGQLNALFIENGAFSWDWYDPFPRCRALDAQAQGEASYYIRWGDNEVEALSESGGFTRVRHRRTGYEMDVPSDFLFTREGTLRVNDVSDYRPPVTAGDVLSLVRRTERGAMIKKNGVSGWYAGRLTEL